MNDTITSLERVSWAANITNRCPYPVIEENDDLRDRNKDEHRSPESHRSIQVDRYNRGITNKKYASDTREDIDRLDKCSPLATPVRCKYTLKCSKSVMKGIQFLKSLRRYKSSGDFDDLVIMKSSGRRKVI